MRWNKPRLFQSRRSGFGVCVRSPLALVALHRHVSVPAIGIWGLRHLAQGYLQDDIAVSVPAIGIWGLRRHRSRHSLVDSCRFSPGDRDLGFASVVGTNTGAVRYTFQSRRSGFGVCVQEIPPPKSKRPVFQSRRSGFGVCVCVSLSNLLFTHASFSPGDRDLGFASPS